jgi:diketogulonate reductase-like aldo/keto reductase
MISRRSTLFFTVVKVILVSLTLFFVIVAFAGPELPSTVSGEIDHTGAVHTSAKFLRSSKVDSQEENMSSAAALSALLPKANSFIRSGPKPPHFLYGTAWKTDRTEELVYSAVKHGFRGIDTACQPKHYYEPGVGNALQRIFSEGIARREEIFLQTKYTSYSGQDKNNVPYDKDAKLEDQVLQSFRASLSNLRTDYLDSLVMHSPENEHEQTMEVWHAFEHIYNEGGARYLGLSNCYDLPVLESLYSDAKVKPSFLQNRFYSQSGYDREIRSFCDEKGIKYQGFWTLTANPKALERYICYIFLLSQL